MDVFDVKSGQPVAVDNPEQMREGLLNGQFSFKKGSKVNVFKGDEVYQIPAGEVFQALDSGWEIETPNITAVREYLKENDNLVGSMKVGAYEFANALTFGVPDIVMRNSGNPLEWAKLNALRDEHVTASLLGEVSGLGANIYSLARTGILKGTEKISEKAVDVLANRIGATLGTGVSKAAANRAAKGILAKTASKVTKGMGIVGRNIGQSALEGGIDMAVPASVEALFGNYDEAAETLLLGTAFGGILGGTLRTAGDAFGSAKSRIMGRSSSQEGSKLQETLLQGMSTQLNIPIDTLRYGLKNAKAVDNALPIEAHFDNLNAAAKNELDYLQRAKDDLKNIEDTLAAKTRLKSTQMDALAVRPNANINDEIIASTAQMKRWLEDQSAVAEEILSKEINLPKIELRPFKRKIDMEINRLSEGKLGQSVGQTLSRLEGLSNDFAALPDFVDGNSARSILRNLREDIRFNEADPAAFDSALDKTLKSLQKDISDTVKAYSPGYRNQMDLMAPKARALDALSPTISTEQKRLGIGKALTTDVPSASQQAVRNRLEQFFAAAEDVEGLENIREVFDEAVRDQKSANLYKKNKRKMLDSVTSDAKDQFWAQQFPDEYQLLSQSRFAAGEAAEAFEALKPLVTNDGRVLESNIKFLDGEKNIALERAYDVLAQRYPERLGDIKTQIKNSLIKKSFGKARTQGSRATGLYGSLIGGGAGAFAGPAAAFLGVAAGAATGAYIDRFGGRIFESLLKETPMASKIRTLLVAENQMGKFAKGIAKIPSHISKIATKKDQASAYRKINRATNHVLLRLLDRKPKEDENNELLDRETRVEAFNQLSKKLAALSSQDAVFEELAKTVSAVNEGGTPSLATRTMEKMSAGIAYLKEEIPKDPNPEKLFVKKGQEWEPSEYDLRGFEQKLLTISDPLIVFDALEADVLTVDHVSALKAVYPKLYEHLTSKIIESLSQSDTELEYADKVSLSLILGIPLDPSMTVENYAYYQGEIAANAQERETQSDSLLKKLNIETTDIQSTATKIRSI